MLEKRWNLLHVPDKEVQSLQETLGLSRPLCNILVQRGFDDYDKSKQFFRPALSQLHSPWLMKDMDKAVSRICTAFEKKEKILVFGDYDVDGTTSVAMMYQFLCQIYESSNIDFYIPHRYREGYGISKAGIDFAKENEFSLVISLDCGIKSVDLISYAKTLDIDFIVCDHHLPDEILPGAVAILNAKQKNCYYPYKELCGCGVGFKLISALAEHFSIETIHFHGYLELVATAIAADIVPMTGENRILTYFGLEKINTDPCPGIKALIKLGGIQQKLSINNVVFVIAPRVNAAGRMDNARKAVLMFIEKNEEKALELAGYLHSDNTERKEADTNITNEALEMIRSNPAMINKKTTVVYDENWHKGVVGIVASRLIEHYYRPTIVLTRSGDVLAGSARSIKGFNLYEAIHACRENLLGYGGHFAAAGLSLLPENLHSFGEQFEQVVSSTIDEKLMIPELVIDTEVEFRNITYPFFQVISQMEPFGPDNLRPVFLAKNVIDSGYSRIVKDLHIRFIVKQENISFTGIGFNLSEKFHLLQQKKPLDIVFTVDENEWNGTRSLQLKVMDLRVSET